VRAKYPSATVGGPTQGTALSVDDGPGHLKLVDIDYEKPVPDDTKITAVGVVRAEEDVEEICA
jgi:hypothetical protein